VINRRRGSKGYSVYWGGFLPRKKGNTLRGKGPGESKGVMGRGVTPILKKGTARLDLAVGETAYSRGGENLQERFSFRKNRGGRRRG